MEAIFEMIAGSHGYDPKQVDRIILDGHTIVITVRSRALGYDITELHQTPTRTTQTNTPQVTQPLGRTGKPKKTSRYHKHDYARIQGIMDEAEKAGADQTHAIMQQLGISYGAARSCITRANQRRAQDQQASPHRHLPIPLEEWDHQGYEQ